MKKIYEKPETILVNVAPTLLTNGSPTPKIQSGKYADTATEQEGGGYQLSRKSSLWDDEE